ncbi:hypothetical protein ACMA5I_15210 [Paracoccaceae bacterium GXU_MW_L88]
MSEASELHECDLIMKGGVTSGVVYPYAITRIKERYRLRGIGGTSAGAIAAAIASAAEYRRQNGGGDIGFNQIDDIAEELSRNLEHMFQPSPELSKPFAIVQETFAKGVGLSIGVFLKTYKFETIKAALLGLIPAGFSAYHGAWGFVLFFLAAALAFIAFAIGAELRKVFSERLPAADFGLCSGKTQPGHQSGEPALTDWMFTKIQMIAGRDSSTPLTVGDLKASGITLATMTTDLSTQRPYRLPLRDGEFFVCRSEMQRLFQDPLVEYLCADQNKRQVLHQADPEDLYALPGGDKFPVILLARMSLSFPGLISAVPIWREDVDAKLSSEDAAPMTRLLFSDGGISSNFPVHFFDSPLPRRPTFGIKLTTFDERIHGKTNVYLPKTFEDIQRLRTGSIKSISDFLFAIFNTAKDWRDTLQSHLPGYAERIVEIRLESGTGGLNFNMDEQTIEELQDLGREAGDMLVSEFSSKDQLGFKNHRIRRALSILPSIEDMMTNIHDVYWQNSTDEKESYRHLITDFETDAFQGVSSEQRRTVIAPFLDGLAKTGYGILKAEADGKGSVRDLNILRQDASLRLTASAEEKSYDTQAPSAPVNKDV